MPSPWRVWCVKVGFAPEDLPGYPHVNLDDSPSHWGRKQFREHLGTMDPQDPDYWKYWTGAKYAPCYDTTKPLSSLSNLWGFFWTVPVGILAGYFAFDTYGLSAILFIGLMLYMAYIQSKALNTFTDPTLPVKETNVNSADSGRPEDGPGDTVRGAKPGG